VKLEIGKGLKLKKASIGASRGKQQSSLRHRNVPMSLKPEPWLDDNETAAKFDKMFNDELKKDEKDDEQF